MSWVSLDDFRFLGLLAVLGVGTLYQLKLYKDSDKKPAPKYTLESVRKLQDSVAKEEWKMHI